MWAQVNELLFKKYFGTVPVTPLHNSKRSYGSSEKDTDREPAAAAVAAAGHLVSSLYSVVYILGAKFQSVVNYCKHTTNVFLNDGDMGHHPGFLLKLQRDSPGLLVCYSGHISGATLKISACCELFQACN